MIIDVHAHYYSYINPQKALEAFEKYGISRVYLSNPNQGYGFYSGKEGVDFQNKVIVDFVKLCPEKLRYMCYLNPALDNTEKTLRKAVEEDNAKGIKLWVATTADDPRVNAVVELSIHYNIPVLIHTFHKFEAQIKNESTGYNIANIAKRYPEAKFIMAHLGGDAYYGIKSIRHLKNVWTDISGSNFRNGEIDYAVKLLGADRILFGTDTLPIPYHTNIGKVNEAAISREDKEKIFWRNAINFFGEAL